MRDKLFNMGAKFDNGWQADNKTVPQEQTEESVKPPEQHRLHLAKERRRGKVVTVVRPFYLPKQTLQTLLKSLKKNLGTGGTVREESLEFQGDIQDRLKRELETRHYRFKA